MKPMKNAEFPWLALNLRQLPFALLDLETTGFNPERDRVTEIAVIRCNNGCEEEFSTLVDPGIPIPYEISRLTGINDRMVHGQPKLEQVMPRLENLLHNTILVTHNVPFDWKFLAWAFRQYRSRALCMPSICTLRLARQYLQLNSNKLASVAAHFGIPLHGAHRAMADTVAVRDILYRFLDELETRGICTGNDLYRHGVIRFSSANAKS